MELEKKCIKLLLIFLAAVAIEGKFLRANKALPSLCHLNSAASQHYLISYAYAEDDPLNAKMYLEKAKILASKENCPELNQRIDLLQKRLNSRI